MECYSTVLGNFFAIFKNILKLIQIIGPILMLIALSINLYTMVKDPEDKKTPKKIKNSIIALILLFFVPIFVNVLLQNILGSSNVGVCYKNATFNKEDSTYKDPYNRSKKDAKENYSNYKNGTDKDNSSSSDSNSSTNETTTGIIFLGDSRTVQMYAYNAGTWNNVNYSDGGAHKIESDIYIAQVSQGLAWMKSTGIPAAKNYMGSGKKLVIMMGVNDLNNASNYLSYINENYSSWTAKGGKVYFVSVNPTSGSYNNLNTSINSFNTTLKNGLNSKIGWINTHDNLTFTTTDGLHYDKKTSVKIYNYIKNHV